MTDSELCDWCSHLVISILEPSSDFWFYNRRTRLEFQEAAKASNCSFCQEFCETAESLHEKVEDDTDLWLWSKNSMKRGNGDENHVILCMEGKKVRYHFERLAYWKMKYSKTNELERSQHMNRPGWRKGTMNIESRFDSIVDWLSDCTNNKYGLHNACLQVRMTERPSRLLDISQVELSGYLRLVSTRSWRLCPEYTTLSHCWGPEGGPRPLKTTKDTKLKHESGIQFGDLPRTFREAIRITRRIGRSFIWIDSLAIIQDDPDDWAREAAKMASVYANSFLTIAATSADNCNGGCDLDPWYLDIPEGVTNPRSAQISVCSAEMCDLCETSSYPFDIRPDLKYRYHVKLKRSTEDEIYAPLYQRGWVMQERFLSRRILHMAHHNMLWQCQAVSDSEDVPILAESSDKNKWIRDLSLVGREAPDKWGPTIQNYSKSNFTYPSDRIPALAGIIQYQSAQLQEESLLGLWPKTIAHDLSWTVIDSSEIALRSNLPTWSWLSSAGEIEPPQKLREVLFRLYLGYGSITWTKQPYISELDNCPMKSSLFVASLITEHVITLNLESEKDPSLIHNTIEKHLQEMFRGQVNAWNKKAARRDDRSIKSTVRWSAPIECSTSHQIAITYLLLYADTGWRHEGIHFLILKRVADHGRIYTRMGLGSMTFYLNPNLDPKSCISSKPFIGWVLKPWKGSVLELR